MACRQRLLNPLIIRTTVLVRDQTSHECVSVETGGGRSTGGSVSRTPTARCPCSDGHLPRPPRRPVAGCRGNGSVARCRGPRCQHAPCPGPPRPLVSWPFSQPCRSTSRVVNVGYNRRCTIGPCGLWGLSV